MIWYQGLNREKLQINTNKTKNKIQMENKKSNQRKKGQRKGINKSQRNWFEYPRIELLCQIDA